MVDIGTLGAVMLAGTAVRRMAIWPLLRRASMLAVARLVVAVSTLVLTVWTISLASLVVRFLPALFAIAVTVPGMGSLAMFALAGGVATGVVRMRMAPLVMRGVHAADLRQVATALWTGGQRAHGTTRGWTVAHHAPSRWLMATSPSAGPRTMRARTSRRAASVHAGSGTTVSRMAVVRATVLCVVRMSFVARIVVRMIVVRMAVVAMIVMRVFARLAIGPRGVTRVRTFMSVAVVVSAVVGVAVVASTLAVTIEAGELNAHGAPNSLGVFRRYPPIAEFDRLVLSVGSAQRTE